MEKPADNSAVTADQIAESINIDHFPKSTPDKNWHTGLFEPWAMQFGYADGMPLYGSVLYNGASIHIYFLNDGHQCPIILRNGETPATYGVNPQ